MSATADAGQGTQRSVLAALRGSGTTGTGQVRRRLRLKNRSPVVPINVSSRPASAVTGHGRQTLHSVEGPEEPEPENVQSLATYLPTRRRYEVSLTFTGQAGEVIGKLMTELDMHSPNELVKRAIPLLLSAQGKEVLLRDPHTGTIEVVKV